MYPKPPKDFFPKAGDITTLRRCNFCGHELAQYRGIVENKPSSASLPSDTAKNTTPIELTSQQSLVAPVDDAISQDEWFFCNAEHQASFHANETYQP